MKRSLKHLAIPLIVALAATVTGLLMFSKAARLSDGAPALALDDSYIHLQYAWQASQGHFLQYNTGDAPTTGATSLLYMLLLASGFAIGITRQAMPGTVMAFGGGMLVLAAVLLSDLARRVGDGVGQKPSWFVGLLAGLLFATNGWMAWAFFSGMETGLLIVLVIGTLWATLNHKTALAAFLASLAVLTRPEVLLLGMMLLASDWLVRDNGVSQAHPYRRLWTLVPIVASLIPFAINYYLTGSLSSSGLLAKSLFTFVPFYPIEILRTIASYIIEIGVLVFGGPSSNGYWLTFPLAQFLALVGAILIWRSANSTLRRFVIVSVGWPLLGIAATATLQTATWHHYRYQMPFYPALLTPLAMALTSLAEQIIGRLRYNSEFLVRLGLIIGMVLWGGYSLAGYLPVYALDTNTLATQQMVLATWLHDNTPRSSNVAVHDVGTLRFISNRHTLDLIGLTTPDMATNYRNGPGSIYEALEHSKPDYYAIYTDPDLPIFAALRASDLLGEELFRVRTVPFSGATSATSTQVITRPDWSRADLADAPQQPDVRARLDGWILVDSIDVAALEDESAHTYAWWNQGTPAGFPSDVRKMRYRLDPSTWLADGGRLMTGGEAFNIKTIPATDLTLVARLHQTTDMVLHVTADGNDAGLWRLPAIPGEWLESTFTLPGDLITADHTRVEITVEEMFDPSPESRYSPFYYWVFQGRDAQAAAIEPQNTSQASFGHVAQLKGFDLSHSTAAPGDTLDLRLYWLALDPPHANLRVFAHLVDPDQADIAEGILAQADSAPHQGTYPFWAWQPNEIVADTLRLTIPPDALPGQYLLLIGIYDAATGERQPITDAVDFGADRLLLARVTVR